MSHNKKVIAALRRAGALTDYNISYKHYDFCYNTT